MQKVLEHLGEVLLAIAIIAILIGVGVYVTNNVGNKISSQVDGMSTTAPAWTPTAGE